jgi:tRNA1(Val) A37 N6-methylase TrmN6
MSPKKKYGVVYTPDRLANFVASLLSEAAKADRYRIESVLDPACGEGALLKAAKQKMGKAVSLIGIDVDKDAVASLREESKHKITLFNKDAILPPRVKVPTSIYWGKQLPKISSVIANPPWSSEKIYANGSLDRAGFNLVSGQYDSYVLFIELAYAVLAPGGYFGFILPDSVFESQNEQLRRFLVANTQIKVIARLGEKIFEEVNRAATVIVGKKEPPNAESTTMCFRLTTNARKEFLASSLPLEQFYDDAKHPVKQSRFQANKGCNFDVDAKSNEESLLTKIMQEAVDWQTTFLFGRGVELSKKGSIAVCPACGHAQGYIKAQLENKKKDCAYCGDNLPLIDDNLSAIISNAPFEGGERILVGENVKRYVLTGESYIRLNVSGINYKNRDLYVPPKILIRKTGLGIYACVDYGGDMTSQTVYIIRYRHDKGAPPLEYYLALLNSRVVYYYYLKVYGENEWKSHPYLTKGIIFSLPLRRYTNSELCEQIAHKAKQLLQSYSYKADLELEKLIFDLYGFDEDERKAIADAMDELPNLSAVNPMKFERAV